MRISHWLTRLQNYHPARKSSSARKSSRRVPRQSTESLERRTLLTTVGILTGPTELTIFVDDGDAATVQRNVTTGNVEVLDENGQPYDSIPSIQADQLTSLNIFADDADNFLSVAPVNASEFSMLNTIVIESGNGDDVITGSDDFAETIDAGDGADTITGGGGDDTIDGGDGDDSILGGAGQDSIIGDDGQDTIDGGADADDIDAGDGQDSVDGGDGDDTINAGDGLDTVNGGAGADSINGMSGIDILNGDADNDTILGGSENDIVSGGDGNDIVNGQAGNDTVNGDAGDDTAYGGGGRDSLSGGDGDDIINGQSGNDTLLGNDGSDRGYGGSGNDSLDGGAGNDTLRGHSGNDTLVGSQGADNVDGGSGDDFVDERENPEVILPLISVNDVTVVEGDSGSTLATFVLSLSEASDVSVSVSFSTTDGTASANDNDFQSTSGIATFGPGETSQTVSVQINGDVNPEFNEVFFLTLSSPVNAALGNLIGTSTITTDETATSVAFASTLSGDIYNVDLESGSLSLIGNSGFTTLLGLATAPDGTVFAIRQSPQVGILTIDTTTGQGTLVGDLTPQPGRNVEGDLAYDTANNVLYATLAGGPPVLYQIDPVTAVSTTVSNLLTSGTPIAGGFIDSDALTFRNGQLISVIPQGATGADAVFNDSLLSIDPATGEITRIGPLGVDLTTSANSSADIIYDAAVDQFVLIFGTDSDSELYTVDPTTGTATFIGNTGVPSISGLAVQTTQAQSQLTVSVGDASIVEGDAGTSTIDFQVSLSSAATTAISIPFSTVAGSAAATDDFVSVSGNVMFAVGESTQTVSVPVVGDMNLEGTETFFLALSPAGGVSLLDPVGTATITDNDVLSSNTLLGSSGNDTVFGSGADDVIQGGDGNDSLDGAAGDDSITGGDGNDTIDGGDGDDTIAGQGGDDLITTGAGIDTVLWNGLGNGTDTILESEGAETLIVQGDSGVNNFDVDSNSSMLRVSEGAASITVAVSTTTVNVFGGSEDDTITISSLADVNPLVLNVDGQADDDTISALDANIGDVRMFLNGGTGNDTITGSRDSDSINGDGGDDSVVGGLGNDRIDGGDGNDTLNGEAGNDTLLGNLGNDMALGGDGDDSLSGGFGNDTLVGEAGNDSASGGFGNDVLNGNSGNDLLAGGQDDDKLLGGSGDDSLDGDSGDDTLRGQSDSDLIKGGDGNDVILGDSGNDVISGGDGDDDIDSGNGDDIVTGADGNDTLNGMSGDDTLLGGDGNDNQLGGSGVDSLYGENGDDSLNGGGSTDQFNGGEGADVLVTPDAGEFDDNNLAIETSVLEALELLNGF